MAVVVTIQADGGINSTGTPHFKSISSSGIPEEVTQLFTCVQYEGEFIFELAECFPSVSSTRMGKAVLLLRDHEAIAGKCVHIDVARKWKVAEIKRKNLFPLCRWSCGTGTKEGLLQ